MCICEREREGNCVCMCVIVYDIESVTIRLCMQMFAHVQHISMVRQKGGKVEVKGAIILVI